MSAEDLNHQKKISAELLAEVARLTADNKRLAKLLREATQKMTYNDINTMPVVLNKLHARVDGLAARYPLNVWRGR
jgi:cell shape-determining protein MreC